MDPDDAEQRELKLRRDSRDLVTDLERRIPRLIGKPTTGVNAPPSTTNSATQYKVEARRIQYVINLVNFMTCIARSRVIDEHTA